MADSAELSDIRVPGELFYCHQVLDAEFIINVVKNLTSGMPARESSAGECLENEALFELKKQKLDCFVNLFLCNGVITVECFIWAGYSAENGN